MVNSIINTVGNGLSTCVTTVDQFAHNTHTLSQSIQNNLYSAKDAVLTIINNSSEAIQSFPRSVQDAINETGKRVHEIFEKYKYHALYLSMAGLQGSLSPHQFVVGATCGFLGHTVFNLFAYPFINYEAQNELPYLCDRGYEASIAQSVFLTTAATCEAARVITNTRYISNEATTSAILSGTFFGVFLSSSALKFMNALTQE